MPTSHPVVVRGRLFVEGRLQKTAVGFDPAEGLVTAIGRDLEGDTVHDHGDKLVLPGALDIHVHFRDPGHPHKEDFASGTLAALYGGVTAVYDMPNTDPATVDVDALAAKRADVATKAHVDWGLYGGATAPGARLRALAAEVDQLKIYLGESTGCVTLEDPETLPAVFDDLHAAGFRGIVAFHAEAKHVLAEAGAAHRDDPGLDGHEARRPAHAETEAFDQIVAAYDAFVAKHDEHPRFRIHIAHASTPGLLDQAEARGWSFGVTPQHMLLHKGLPLEAHGRLNPPLRDKASMDTVWARMVDRRVPICESDHAPHTVAEKDQPVVTAPSGMPGVETMVPLLMARVARGALDLSTLVHAVAERPALLMAVPKGRIAVGHHADLAVYDLDDVETIDAARLHSRAGWTPFAGHEGVFPTDVFVRGHHALVEREVHAVPGLGHELRRTGPAVREA